MQQKVEIRTVTRIVVGLSSDPEF